MIKKLFNNIKKYEKISIKLVDTDDPKLIKELSELFKHEVLNLEYQNLVRLLKYLNLYELDNSNYGVYTMKPHNKVSLPKCITFNNYIEFSNFLPSILKELDKWGGLNVLLISEKKPDLFIAITPRDLVLAYLVNDSTKQMISNLRKKHPEIFVYPED